jgi:hypothetical protein
MTSDRDIIRVFEASAIVGAAERIGRRWVAAVRHSRLLPLFGAELDAARRRPGVTVLTATAVHVMLMLAIARPPAWYWLILPSIFAISGALLWVMVDSRLRPR